MERKTGEIFEYKGEWYQCVEAPQGVNGNLCRFCRYKNAVDCTNDDSECRGTYRSDGKCVIFKKLKKSGGPFTCNYFGDARLLIMQKYKLYHIPAILPDVPRMYTDGGTERTVAIEIKQNQEDMEEKNLDKQMMETANDELKKIYETLIKKINEVVGKGLVEDSIFKAFKESLPGEKKPDLKPFNLEQAKAGKPVCTRDGRKARIVCFDAEGRTPLIVLSKINGKEIILRYTEEGRSDNFHSPTPREDDLMMLSEKHEGWMNMYKSTNGKYFSNKIYDTKEQALEGKKNGWINDYVATVKIEWEE